MPFQGSTLIAPGIQGLTPSVTQCRPSRALCIACLGTGNGARPGLQAGFTVPHVRSSEPASSGLLVAGVQPLLKRDALQTVNGVVLAVVFALVADVIQNETQVVLAERNHTVAVLPVKQLLLQNPGEPGS